jgi:hypothetical protein
MLVSLARLPLLATLLVAPAVAQSQSPFVETVSFGDSLTCNWPLALIFHGPPARWGRDPIEAVFAKAAQPQDRLTDYAAVGARATELRGQLQAYGDRFLAGDPVPGTFFSWQAGTNEFLDQQAALRRDAPGQNPATDLVVDQLLLRAFRQVHLLMTCHPTARIAVWTIPDVTLLPAWWGQLQTQEIANVRAHLRRANGALRAFELFPRVALLDLETLWQVAATTPLQVGGRPLLPPPAFGRGDALFADPIHPSAVFNALAANVLILRMNSRWGWRLPFYSEAELLAMTQAS